MNLWICFHDLIDCIFLISGTGGKWVSFRTYFSAQTFVTFSRWQEVSQLEKKSLFQESSGLKGGEEKSLKMMTLREFLVWFVNYYYEFSSSKEKHISVKIITNKETWVNQIFYTNFLQHFLNLYDLRIILFFFGILVLGFGYIIIYRRRIQHYHNNWFSFIT